MRDKVNSILNELYKVRISESASILENKKITIEDVKKSNYDPKLYMDFIIQNYGGALTYSNDSSQENEAMKHVSKLAMILKKKDTDIVNDITKKYADLEEASKVDKSVTLYFVTAPLNSNKNRSKMWYFKKESNAKAFAEKLKKEPYFEKELYLVGGIDTGKSNFSPSFADDLKNNPVYKTLD